MSADTKPSFGPQLSRREFLKLAAIAGGGEIIVAAAGGTGTAVGLAARLLTEKLNDSSPAKNILRGSPRGEFVYGKDPLNFDRIEPYDLGQSRLGYAPVGEVIDEVTGGNGGPVSYQELTRQTIKSKMVFVGEPHFETGDKVLARELLYAIYKANPDRQIVVVLGRPVANDDPALDAFINSDRGDFSNVAFDKAVARLSANSSLGTSFTSMNDYASGSPDTSAYEYGNFLKMLRLLRITTRGIGVDVGTTKVRSEPTPTYLEKQEIEERESKAAQTLFDLEQKNPEAIIFVFAGRPHIQRGTNGEGITPKLEALHYQDKNLSSIRPLVVNTVATTLGDGDTFERIRYATGNQLPQNSVLAIKNPRYSSEIIVNQTSGTRERRWPGADFLVLRYI